MANQPTFYGEVLQTHSRAVDEEEDESDAEVEYHKSAVLCWSPVVQKYVDSELSIPCTVLTIAIDSVATGFIKTHYLHLEHERIGGVFTGLSDKSSNSFNQESFTDESCYIYRLKAHPSILFCQCNTKVQPEQAFSWVQQLLGVIEKANTYIAVLSHKSVHEYTCQQPSSQLQVPFLRALKSSYFQGVPISPYLEQPNIVEGLVAQVLTYCQVHGMPVVYYCCYAENIYLDIHSMLEFTKLTSITPFKDFYQENPNRGEEMRKLVLLKNSASTLYM